jgi:hypothetical protein
MLNATSQPPESTSPSGARPAWRQALPWLVLALAAGVGALAVRAAWREIAASGMDLMQD